MAAATAPLVGPYDASACAGDSDCVQGYKHEQDSQTPARLKIADSIC